MQLMKILSINVAELREILLGTRMCSYCPQRVSAVHLGFFKIYRVGQNKVTPHRFSFFPPTLKNSVCYVILRNMFLIRQNHRHGLTTSDIDIGEK